jgi:hypothetical protein
MRRLLSFLSHLVGRTMSPLHNHHHRCGCGALLFCKQRDCAIGPNAAPFTCPTCQLAELDRDMEEWQKDFQAAGPTS